MSVINSRTRTRSFRLRSLRAPVAQHDSRQVSDADRNAERLLRLLGDSDMTISELRERGVRSPAQGVYDLLLAGYPIRRVHAAPGLQESAVQYRLDSRPGPPRGDR